MNTTIKKLQQDPHYEEFFDNYGGKKELAVEIKGIPCIFYNTTQETIEGYLRIAKDWQNFPQLANEVRAEIIETVNFLNSELNKRNKR